MHLSMSRRLPCAMIAAACVCAVLLLPSAAQANLNPGDTEYNPAVVPPLPPPAFTIGPVPASYNVILASTVFPYNYMPGNPAEAYFGSVTSNVYQNNAGQLAFSYVFNNINPGGAAPRTDISHVTINDPTNPWTGVTIFGAGADAGGNSTAVPGAFGAWTNGNPFDITRDAADNGLGIFFNAFQSGTELVNTTNDASATIWFTTDATHFQVSNIGMIDTGTTGAGNAYAPLVPEPSSIALLGLGALGLSVIVRRSRTKQRAPN